MNPLRLGLFTVAITATTFASPASAQDGGGIQRCEAPDGTAIYTDKACSALGAAAAPMSSGLLTRLAYDNGGGGFDTGAFGRRQVHAVARRSAAGGCARSTTQLSMDLQGAWALGDVNRIAESYHWPGLGSDQARSIMQRLERLAGQPLWQVHYFDARVGGGMMQLADAATAASPSAGVMQLVFGDGSSPQVQNFEVQRYLGCYFVHF